MRSRELHQIREAVHRIHREADTLRRAAGIRVVADTQWEADSHQEAFHPAVGRREVDHIARPAARIRVALVERHTLVPAELHTAALAAAGFRTVGPAVVVPVAHTPLDYPVDFPVGIGLEDSRLDYLDPGEERHLS